MTEAMSMPVKFSSQVFRVFTVTKKMTEASASVCLTLGFQCVVSLIFNYKK